MVSNSRSNLVKPCKYQSSRDEGSYWWITIFLFEVFIFFTALAFFFIHPSSISPIFSFAFIRTPVAAFSQLLLFLSLFFLAPVSYSLFSLSLTSPSLHNSLNHCNLSISLGFSHDFILVCQLIFLSSISAHLIDRSSYLNQLLFIMQFLYLQARFFIGSTPR